MALTVVQLVPALEVGGVERGTIEIAGGLVAAGHRALVVSAGGRLVAEIEALGAEHVCWPIGHKRPWTLKFIPKLRRLFIEESVDVVHARSRFPAWLGRFALGGLPIETRPRWVTTIHGPYTVNAYSAVMASGERVIAISEFVRDYIRAAYPRTEHDRVRLIHRGVDRARYPFEFVPSPDWLDAWHQQLPELQGRKVLTIAGRLTRWKGQAAFIPLVERLIARGREVHGLIVGGRTDRGSAFEAELRALVADRKLEDRITFLGQRVDLREIFAVSDLAFSLTSEPEAFGRTTLEALSLGTPVIGFDHGGTAEILRVVFPAGLVACGDIEQAVERSEQLLDAPAPIKSDHAFTVEAMQRATLNVYAELCPTQ